MSSHTSPRSDKPPPQYDDIFTRAADPLQPNYLEVPMNDVNVLALPAGTSGTIATRNLGGSSGVVILGCTAAILAHVAPRSPLAPDDQVSSEQYFRNMVEVVAFHYRAHRHHFPPESTAWGFFLKGKEVEGHTKPLVAIATQFFHNLGLTGGPKFYEPYTGEDWRGQVRVCAKIEENRVTTFYIESEAVEKTEFPPQPPPRSKHSNSPDNYLKWDATSGSIVQRYLSTEIPIRPSAFSGVYDVYDPSAPGRARWRQYNFDTKTWVQPQQLLS